MSFDPELAGRTELAGGKATPGLTAWERVLAAFSIAASVLGIADDGPFRWIALPGLGFLTFLALRHARLAGRALSAAREDHRGLVDLPAQATFIAEPDGGLLHLSKRWYDWTGLDFAATAESNWIEALHPDDRRRCAENWASCLQTGRDFSEEYRLCTRTGDYRWFHARAFPQRNASEVITRWVGAVEDVHDRHLAEEQLRQTATLLEMIGTSTDSLIWAKDRDGRMLYVKRALEHMAGITLADVLGRTDIEWNPNTAEAEAFSEADRRVLEAGSADDVEESFTCPNGIVRHYRSLRSPLRERNGQIIGTVGVATDITESREAEEREWLLSRELDHRAKNLLAVVQSVVILTRASTVTEFKEAVEGRIQALGRSHSMLASARWEGAELGQIVREELAPYTSDGTDWVAIAGPPLVLRPAAAQSLALVIHELATNAVKYGALSSDDGRLDIFWELESSRDGIARLRLTWTERGGPPVVPRTERSRSGFGTRLLHSSIERQLGGTLDLNWAAEGLVARLDLPVDRAMVPHSPSPTGTSPRTGSEPPPVPRRRHVRRHAA